MPLLHKIGTQLFKKIFIIAAVVDRIEITDGLEGCFHGVQNKGSREEIPEDPPFELIVWR